MEESGRKHGLPGNLFLLKLLSKFTRREITVVKSLFCRAICMVCCTLLRNVLVGHVTSHHTCPSFRNSVRSSDEHATGVIHVSRPKQNTKYGDEFFTLGHYLRLFVSAGDSNVHFLEFNFGVAGAILENHATPFEWRLDHSCPAGTEKARNRNTKGANARK
ncbi:hypothetical protein DAPPUDRAFT_108997 [Daphnia pulex]|uniref:Uncharacterized protein n=1 Tax=Daphnia pulex TaxID=6669 RepID=E9H1Q8_DAPPU|nr:hypothetical protein DAPPUDRAFT_108997 [Daphnia pulex]|eukprot:EFX74326.1 hypothetical protein DAPPUDRAFT_108997 [Daphnia pulex]